MPNDQMVRVVGIRENGDRVVITWDTTRQIAEQIVSMMSSCGGFVDLVIESHRDAERRDVDDGRVACDEPAPAGSAARQ
jgi:hypothetical protein